MHLIYIRFYTKFLRDLGLINFDEPALKYFTQGIVKGKDGERMSKSKGNVIEPSEMIEKYGADSLRLYLVSNSSPERDFDWDDKGIYSSFKFVNKVYEYFSKFKEVKSNAKVESKLNKSIKIITEDIEEFKHNLAVIKIRSLFDIFVKNGCDKKSAEAFLKMLHVYCPFVTEELWEKLGNKNLLSLSEWPKVDELKINEKFDKADEAFDKVVSDIINILRIVKGEKVYIYVLPDEFEFYNAKEISDKVRKDVKVNRVNDKDKHDPKGKSKKAKPGKPAIYVE